MPFNPFVESRDSLDYIVLAGLKSPGQIEAPDGAGSPRKWDEQQGYGTSGATLKWTGDGLAEFSIKFLAWLPEHFVEWETFGKLCKKTPPGVKPKAYDIQHPTLDEVEIHAVVITDSHAWVPEDDTGKWSKTVDFKSYRAPKPAIGKPDGAKDGPNDPASAKDAQDRELEENQKKLEKLQQEDAKTP